MWERIKKTTFKFKQKIKLLCEYKLTWEDYFLTCRLASTQQDNHDLVPQNMQSAAGKGKLDIHTKDHFQKKMQLFKLEPLTKLTISFTTCLLSHATRHLDRFLKQKEVKYCNTFFCLILDSESREKAPEASETEQ